MANWIPYSDVGQVAHSSRACKSEETILGVHEMSRMVIIKREERGRDSPISPRGISELLCYMLIGINIITRYPPLHASFRDCVSLANAISIISYQTALVWRASCPQTLPIDNTSCVSCVAKCMTAQVSRELENVPSLEIDCHQDSHDAFEVRPMS